MTNYFNKNKLPISYTGKLVVATNKNEYKKLKELYKLGKRNKIQLQMITAKQARIKES